MDKNGGEKGEGEEDDSLSPSSFRNVVTRLEKANFGARSVVSPSLLVPGRSPTS